VRTPVEVPADGPSEHSFAIQMRNTTTSSSGWYYVCFGGVFMLDASHDVFIQIHYGDLQQQTIRWIQKGMHSMEAKRGGILEITHGTEYPIDWKARYWCIGGALLMRLFWPDDGLSDDERLGAMMREAFAPHPTHHFSLRRDSPWP